MVSMKGPATAGATDRAALPGLVGVGVGILGVLFLFRPLLLTGRPGSWLWGNDFDPNFIVWTVEWARHVLFERWDWANLWNANSFFPHQGTFAYSDSMLTAQIVYAPLRALGYSPVASLYGTMAACCVAGAVLTDHALAREGAFSVAERILITFVAHFGLATIVVLPPHYQLFGFQFAPAFLLTLRHLLNGWRGRDLVGLAVLFALTSSFASYFIPMAVLISAAVAVAFLPRILRSDAFRAAPGRLGVIAPLLTVGLAVAFYLIQVKPYLALFSGLAPQSMEETAMYSARPLSILSSVSVYSFWYKSPGYQPGEWEWAYFPGAILLLLAFIGLIAPLFRWGRGEVATRATAPVPLFAFAIVVLAVAWVLSLGPTTRIGEHTVRLPFWLFAKLVPGVENVRTPGRFGQFFGLPLALIAVSGLRALLSARPATRRIATVAAALALIVEALPVIPLYPYAVAHEAFYREAAPRIGAGEPTMVLPTVGEDHIHTVLRVFEHLKGSTFHWGRLVSGFGSRITPEEERLFGLDNDFRAGRADMQPLLAFARELGVTRLVLFPEDYPPERRQDVRNAAAGLTVLHESPEGILVSLTAK